MEEDLDLVPIQAGHQTGHRGQPLDGDDSWLRLFVLEGDASSALDVGTARDLESDVTRQLVEGQKVAQFVASEMEGGRRLMEGPGPPAMQALDLNGQAPLDRRSVQSLAPFRRPHNRSTQQSHKRLSISYRRSISSTFTCTS